MKWSFKIGRMFGIDVYMHATFLLLLAFIGVTDWAHTHSIQSVIMGLVFILALFGCVVLHEYGHALTARRYGIATRDITLLPIGGVARLERIPEKPLQELGVALAGPAVNIVIALLIWVWLTATNTWTPLEAVAEGDGGFLERLFFTNIFLVLFNMVPAFPMDGGRVLRALLALRMEYRRATRIAASVGQMLAFAFGLFGLYVSHPMLVLVAVFVWIGASQEAAATEMRMTIGGVPVRDAMLTEFHTLAPDDSLSTATRFLIMGSQRDFPVVDDGRVAGILTHARLFEVLRASGEDALVSEAMERDFRIVHPEDPIQTTLFQEEPALTVLPVLRQGRLVGLLTAENVGELFMIRAARAEISTHRPHDESAPSRDEL